MCGICGSFARAPDGTVDRGRVARMTEALVHRGPDDEGTWSGDGASLGFRRLAVIDLSEAANQPHATPDGRIQAVVNGEIYNYRALRRELEGKGHTFRSDGDAEVVPHLYREYGDEFVARLEGMFALAIVDQERGRLLLARDRLGKKPLYYAVHPDRIDFASEAKALLRAGAAAGAVADPAELVRFLCFGYVPATGSAIRGLSRVAPAHIVSVDAAGGPIRSARYWTPAAASDAPPGDDLEAWKRAIWDRLLASTRDRLKSDVPLGVFLSGGIDSGLVLAAARDVSDSPPRAFTIGFDERSYDERELAAATARHLGIESVVEVAQPAPERALREIAEVYDEPFGDPSAYPTLLLSRLTRRHVTVALSGDGGDESFGGYRRHRAVGLAARWERALPGSLRRRISSWFGEPGNGVAGRGAIGQLRRFIAALGLDAEQRNLYWSTFFRAPLRSRLLHADLLEAAAGVDPEAESLQAIAASGDRSPLRRALNLDLLRYLPDDLLVKTDMASMSCGLEIRSPLLDHRMVELAQAAPDPLLIRGGQTKFVLRELAKDHLPPEVVGAAKRGFGVPLASWLRGPLASTAREYLLSSRFSARRLLRDGVTEEILTRHQSGREDWSSYLWLLLVLEAWHRRVVDGEA